MFLHIRVQALLSTECVDPRQQIHTSQPLQDLALSQLRGLQSSQQVSLALLSRLCFGSKAMTLVGLVVFEFGTKTLQSVWNAPSFVLHAVRATDQNSLSSV